VEKEPEKMNAHENNKAINSLITYRHREDMLFAEAMQGSSRRVDAGVSRRRLDYWVVVPSWSKPRYIGYEVKVSRSDFLRDDKAHTYESQCTEFIWVTAKGVVHDIREIPEGHGWQELSANGARIVTKKKAPRIKPDTNAIHNAIKSVLMRAIAPRAGLTKREFFEVWLERREIDNTLGRMVSRKLRQEITEKINKVEAENIRLKRENKHLQSVKEMIEDADLKHCYSSAGVAQQLIAQAKEAASGISVGTIQRIDRARVKLERITKELRDLKIE